jgi:dephospho-CoA kinase
MSIRVIAIGGEPGSGKSTLMKEIIGQLPNVEEKYKSTNLVPYLQSGHVYVLGKYEEGEVFSGTDRMSMAVQPEAIKFVDALPAGSIVLYEGDRLFTASFLEHCVDKHDLQILYLSTDKAVRQERYKERGSDQNEKWLKGRETKISNILSNFLLMFNVYKYENNTLEEQKEILESVNIKLAF